MDPAKLYTLPELIDIAEHNNPDTRVAWENAKARAGDLGIANPRCIRLWRRLCSRQRARGCFLWAYFVRQTVEDYTPLFILEYSIFDLQRSQEIAISRNNLLAANFQFNDTHRRIIFQVMSAYYRLLDDKGLQEAAEANLKNAQTVQQAAEDRLATDWQLCPTFWKRAAPQAQADYDLQAAIGQQRLRMATWQPRLASRPRSVSRSRVSRPQDAGQYRRHGGDLYRQSAGAAARSDATGGRAASGNSGGQFSEAGLRPQVGLRRQRR